MSDTFDMFKKFANLDDTFASSPLAQTGDGLISKLTGQSIIKTKLPGQNFSPDNIESSTMTLNDAQPATTPSKDVVVGDEDPLSHDAYRYGNSNILVPENLSLPRTLGDRDYTDDTSRASIKLAIDPTQPGATLAIEAYSRFILTGVSEPEQEKFQVVETFTNYYAFFFGKRPPFYRYTGILVNDQNHKWGNDFKFFYENFFRGSKATELAGTASLQYDGRLVTGFFVGLSMQQDASVDKGIPFALDMLVLDHQSLNFSLDMKDLIDRRTAEIQTVAQKIRDQIVELNRNVKDTAYKAVKAASAKGKLTAKVKKAGTAEKRIIPATTIAQNVVRTRAQDLASRGTQ